MIGEKHFHAFVRYASGFFVRHDRLWRKKVGDQPQLVVTPDRRWDLVRQAHDDLGHKGVYVTRARLLLRFWWPSLRQDVKYFIKTCHECQLRQMSKILIPPMVPNIVPIFSRIHIDVKHMPRSGGYSFIVHARCSLSSYPEFRLLRKQTGHTIGQFIFQELLCRYGACPELVTDNGTPFVAALDWLKERYHINHIRISAYNSRANGIIERRHLDVQEAIMKVANENATKWHEHAHSVFWAERITIQKTTGYSPYYLVHGVEPILPFDLSEATFLAPEMTPPLSTPELIAARARQLEKRQEDLDDVAQKVRNARETYVRYFREVNKNTIKDYDFKPGRLVLLRNTRVENELDKKSKPRYLGPYVVVRKTKGGAYIIAELDGSVLHHKVAAFRLIPYFPRSEISIPVSRFLDNEPLHNMMNEGSGDEADATSDDGS